LNSGAAVADVVVVAAVAAAVVVVVDVETTIMMMCFLRVGETNSLGRLNQQQLITYFAVETMEMTETRTTRETSAAEKERMLFPLL
jgi:hypothetical protein